MKSRKSRRRHRSLGAAAGCKCVHGKGGRRTNLCPSTKSRSGWAFVAGGCR